jgi:DNA-binding MarR family transcriptional regulator
VPPDPSDLGDADIGDLIAPLYAISTSLQRVVSSKPAVHRLTILQAVAHSNGARPSDLAAALHLHLPQVSRQVQALADEGLLDVVGDPTDRRSRLLHLTDAGRAEVERLVAFGLGRWRGFLADFDTTEVRELARLLTKLQGALAGSSTRSDGASS